MNIYQKTVGLILFAFIFESQANSMQQKFEKFIASADALISYSLLDKTDKPDITCILRPGEMRISDNSALSREMNEHLLLKFNESIISRWIILEYYLNEKNLRSLAFPASYFTSDSLINHRLGQSSKQCFRSSEIMIIKVEGKGLRLLSLQY